MGYRWCYGRECKLGWGWNEPLDRLIPVEADPLNVTSQAVRKWVYYVLDFSSTVIGCWRTVGEHLEPSCKKYLDFQIVFDHNQYWAVYCFFSRRTEGSEKFSKYPSNCSHFIRHIHYGVDLRVYFPKTGFPEKDDEKWGPWNNPIAGLFKDRNLTEIQKNTKCRVLINYNEIREMTLKELMEFMEELEEGKHLQYDIPVRFDDGKLNQEFRETVVNNQTEFGLFLSHLYCVYRKIEMKMEKAGYPDILPDLDSQQKSLVNICVNLNKAKKEYKSMDEHDFLKMYPVLKKLFFRYTDYIRYAIEYLINIDEGDHLPGNCEEIKPWLQQLNTWFPMKINGEWNNCMGQFIGTPKGFEQVIRKLQETTMFKEVILFDDEEVTEPYIGEEGNKKVIFGLVNMEGAKKSEIPNDSKLFEWECPDECTNQSRTWICTQCGEFVSQKEMILYCSCGSKRYKDELLTCFHPSHRSQESNKKQDEQEIPHPPIPDTKETQNQTINHADPLFSICQQLRKLQIKNGETTDPNILIAIIHLQSNNKGEEEIRNILKDLQDMALDGDTQHLINLYLDKNQKSKLVSRHS